MLKGEYWAAELAGMVGLWCGVLCKIASNTAAWHHGQGLHVQDTQLTSLCIRCFAYGCSKAVPAIHLTTQI